MDLQRVSIRAVPRITQPGYYRWVIAPGYSIHCSVNDDPVLALNTSTSNVISTPVRTGSSSSLSSDPQSSTSQSSTSSSVSSLHEDIQANAAATDDERVASFRSVPLLPAVSKPSGIDATFTGLTQTINLMSENGIPVRNDAMLSTQDVVDTVFDFANADTQPLPPPIYETATKRNGI